jgi:hypothetical protein
MRSVTVQKLQRILAEQKSIELLKEEITKVLGPVVNQSVDFASMIVEANDRLQVLERTGRLSTVNFRPSLLLKFANSSNSEVRKFVASTLPSTMLERFMHDKSPAIRHIVAKRIGLSRLKEMVNKYRNDDLLIEIAQKRTQDLSWGEKIKKSEKNKKYMDLSDSWYYSQAHKAISDYDGNIEGLWDELFAVRYSESLKTYGVECDHVRLWKEIQRQLAEKDEMALKKDVVKQLTRSLNEGYDDSFDKIDFELNQILSPQISNLERIKKCNAFFRIKESKFLSRNRNLIEGIESNVTVPVSGKLPKSYQFNHAIEKALDSYESSWNRLQESKGNNLRIKWDYSSNTLNDFVFNVEIK